MKISIFYKIYKKINLIVLALSLLSIFMNGMAKNQTMINQLLNTARENSGKILLACGAIATAGLCYKYWSLIKKSLNPIRNFVIFNNSIVVSSGGRVVINGVEYGSRNFHASGSKEIFMPLLQSIILTNGAGDIEVDSHDSSQLLIKWTKWANTREDLAKIEAKITPHEEQKRVDIQSDLKGVFNGSIDYKIFVPKSFDLNEFNVQNQNGNININNVTIKKSRIETSNGDITANNLWDAILKTSNGNINAKVIAALENFEAYTSCGDITVESKSFSCPYTCKTTNGDVTFIASIRNAKIHLKTNNGTINNQYTLTNVVRSKKKDIHGDIGDAARAPKLELITNNGDISLKKLSYFS